MNAQSSRLVAERDGTRLVIKTQAQQGCGHIITNPQAPQLIQGIEIEPIVQFPDDRGSFAELFRFGEPGLARDFPPRRTAESRFHLRFRIPELSRRSITTSSRPTSGLRSAECCR